MWIVRYSSYLLVTVIPLLALTGASAAYAAAHEPSPRIIVTGEGRAELAPDMALVSLTVAREAATAREALDANSTAMAGVLKAMQNEGIAERDLQTSNFSIQPNYVYPQPDAKGEHKPPRVVGYTVRNSLAVRVRKLETLGAIIDKSVSLGVNEGGDIQFTNADPSAALTAARRDAVRDAISKAQTLATAAGVKPGKLLEISEYAYTPAPAPMLQGRMMAMDAVEAKSVPVAAGENSYTVNVNVTFAIEQ